MRTCFYAGQSTPWTCDDDVSGYAIQIHEDAAPHHMFLCSPHESYIAGLVNRDWYDSEAMRSLNLDEETVLEVMAS